MTALRDRTRLPRLPPPLAFGLVAAVVGMALYASATPSPLYGDYAARWHFSTVTLTLVYAVYAVGVLAALLLVGRLSDELGRRPVLIVALGGLVAAMVVFTLASSVAWLFAARTLQGLATGIALGAAGAALLDLEPQGDARRAALVNGLTSVFGIGFGAFISAVLVQYAPAPRVVPFVVPAVVFALLLAGSFAIAEPVVRRGRPRLTIEWPRVPRGIRREFALACGGVIASWSVGGLFLTLEPSLVSGLDGSANHVVGGIVVLVLALSAAIAQYLVRDASAASAMRRGAVVLVIGMVALVFSLSLGGASTAAFTVATAIAGAGFGAAFAGAIRTVSVAAPPEHRAAVMSAFYVVAYIAISLPAVLAGLLATDVGLEPTFRIFGAIVAAIALATALAARERRAARCGAAA